MKEVIERIREMDFADIFVYDDILGRKKSYNEFFRYCLDIASYIEETVNDNMMIAVMENSYELFSLYFAVMFTDKHIAVVDPQKGEKEIAEIISVNAMSTVFLDIAISKERYDRYKILDFPKENILHSVRTDIKKKVLDKLSQRKWDSEYLITYTSGTSGKTKGVVHSLENLFLSALSLDKKLQRSGIFLHVMPMTYMAGILNSIIYPFITKSPIVITQRFSVITARNFWKVVKKYSATVFWMSPSMLTMIEQMDRGHIGEEYCKNHETMFLIGTASLPSGVRKKFNTRYGVSVYASYGLSETLFISVENENSLKKSIGDSVGEVLDGVRICITKDGEAFLDVPWMYLGYTNEKAEDYFEGSYYKSGDLVKKYKECLYIIGRRKDLIIKGGMNISPVLIEKLVEENFNVCEAVAFGVKDASGEERICCACHIESAIADFSQLENKIKKSVIENLGKNYSVDYIWYLNEIPRNINGKIDKIRLRQIWERNNV